MNQFLEQLRRWLDALLSPIRDLTDDVRRQRRKPTDPTTPAPAASPSTDGDGPAVVVATAYDDALSVVERIEATGADEVILEVPREARALRDPAVWPHIAAVAKRNQMALGVVTPRGDVRNHARENGLRAAGSVGRVTKAPHHRLSVGERTFFVPRLPVGLLIRTAVLLVASYFLVITACNVIPSAEIVIVPASEEATASARVRLNPTLDDPNLELGVSPAVTYRHEFRATLATVTTGETEIPDERATVSLQFFNPGESEVVVSAGTQVDDQDGIGFSTDADVVVPAGSVANVDATAVFAGTGSNVGPGTLILVDGLPDGMTVTNWSSARGGTDQTVPAVSEEDVERISELAKTVLRRIGERELLDAVVDGTAFPQTISVSIYSQESLQNLGEPAEVFIVDFTAIATALVITDKQAARYGEALIQSELAADLEMLPGSASAVVSDPRVDGGTLTVRLEATALAARLVDEVAVGEAVKGKSPADAAVQLHEMLAIEGEPTIHLNPDFIPWRWLPRKADRISVTFAGPASLLEDEGDESEAGEDGESAASSSSTVTATATATP